MRKRLPKYIVEFGVHGNPRFRVYAFDSDAGYLEVLLNDVCTTDFGIKAYASSRECQPTAPDEVCIVIRLAYYGSDADFDRRHWLAMARACGSELSELGLEWSVSYDWGPDRTTDIASVEWHAHGSRKGLRGRMNPMFNL
jgi:hypothetical protein